MRAAARSWRRLGLAAAAVSVIAVGVSDPADARHADGPSASGLIFNGANKTSWTDQSATKTRIRRVPSPSGGGRALRFQAYNQDVFPLTPTTNPRAQLVKSLPVGVGQQFWESYEVYVPKNFPVAATQYGWVALGSPAFGPPFQGSPSVQLAIVDGYFRFQRDGYADHPWQIAWQTPLIVGSWVRFTWHVLLSQNGFVQLYMNGQPAQLADGSTTSTTLDMPVIDQGSARGPWYSQLSVYFKRNVFPQVTLYFRAFRIAKTEALAVAG